MARPDNREDSKRVKHLRNFLIRQPRPTSFRLVTEDGDNDYQVVPETNFANLADQFDSLEPSKIIAYDEGGKPIRAWRADEFAPPAKAVLELPEGIKGDPTAAMLLHFGNLLAQAYEHSTDVAFEKLTEILQTMMESQSEREQRLRSIEDLYFSAMHANADLQAAAAQEGQSPEDFQAQMLQQFLMNKKRAKEGKGPRVVEETPEPEE